MNSTYSVPYSENYFSKIFLDYVGNHKNLESFIQYKPSLSSIANAIENKSKEKINREVLVNTLRRQYENINASEATKQNIEALLNEHTFTITTGHQLGIFTAEWYFIYKIISCIKLADDAKLQHPNKNFVPIFWMATEDHDFAEINHIQLASHTFQWNKNTSGACGHLKTDGLKEIIDSLSTFLADRKFASELIGKFKKAYSENTLAEATRVLVNDLFQSYGLVIIDADDAELKAQFKSVMIDDVINHSAFEKVNESTKALETLAYSTQVNPREINFFYLEENYRERIVKKGNGYETTDSKYQFTKEELLNIIETHPEKMSPNVILRPLYQETILPNLAYIGGPGEIAYWLQFKSMFEYYQVNLPILTWRNSFLIVKEMDFGKWQKQDFTAEELFNDINDLANKYVERHSDKKLNLDTERKELEQYFDKIKDQLSNINDQLPYSLTGIEVRLSHMLDNLEKKMLKHEKRKHSEGLEAIINIKSKYFPNNKLQERKENFSMHYAELGGRLFEVIYGNTNLFDSSFKILVTGE